MATLSTRKGLAKGYTRWTLIVSEKVAERIREIAFYQRKTAWQTVEAALTEYCDAHAKVPGRINSTPKR